MKTLREYHQQQKNDDNRDRHMFDDELINNELNNEQKSHLHQNYRHWGWLPKPH
jgi:hypothetical protein